MTLALLSWVDFAAVVIVCVVMLVALRITGRRIEMRVGAVHATVDDVNRAVNSRPSGDPTMYQQVQSVRLELGNVTSAVAHLCHKQEEMAAVLLTEQVDHDNRLKALEHGPH